MRRVSGLVTLIAIGMLMASVAGASVLDSYRDEFTKPGYTGSDGTLDWSSHAWQEIRDDGNKSTGAVHVDSEGNCVGSSCLHIFGEAVELAGVGAQRRADTSVFSWFELCYEVRFEAAGPLTVAVLNVEKSIDGGENWYLLKSHVLYDDMAKHPTIWIGGPYEETLVRFTVQGVVDGELFIDDVEIKGEPAGEPTTTTSTSSTSSTTTTTAPTTTTTTPTTTTTEARQTTTTSSTTTTAAVVEETTTTTSTPAEETESVVIVDPVDPTDGGGGPPDGSGIRGTPVGLQVAFNEDLFGQVGLVGAGFASVDHDVNFRVLAEAIEASWVWMVILGCLIGWAIVAGLDRRLVRSIKQKWATPRWLSELSD